MHQVFDFVNNILFLEYCEEAFLQHPNDQVPVVFPRTQAGYTNSTVETCFSEDNAANSMNLSVIYEIIIKCFTSVTTKIIIFQFVQVGLLYNFSCTTTILYKNALII